MLDFLSSILSHKKIKCNRFVAKNTNFIYFFNKKIPDPFYVFAVSKKTRVKHTCFFAIILYNNLVVVKIIQFVC